MSNFDDYEGNFGPSVGMDRLLQGAGWDSPIRRIFTEVDLEDDEIEEEREFTRDFENCDCNIVKIRDAADELVKFLQNAPQRIPKSGQQLESFGALGGYASGKWSRYVRVTSSVPYEEESGGVIHLYGCRRPEHQIRVILAGEIEVRERLVRESTGNPVFAEKLTYSPTKDLPEVDDEFDEELSEVDLDVIETEEERRYDERTFGELAEELDEVDQGEDPELAESLKTWRDDAAPEHEIVAYLEAKLELSEVQQIARWMPANEVASWVDSFGQKSMMALEFLRIGLGEISHRTEFAGINVDDVAGDVLEGIRKIISEVFDKYQDQLDFSGVSKKKSATTNGDEEVDVELY